MSDGLSSPFVSKCPRVLSRIGLSHALAPVFSLNLRFSHSGCFLKKRGKGLKLNLKRVFRESRASVREANISSMANVGSSPPADAKNSMPCSWQARLLPGVRGAVSLKVMSFGISCWGRRKLESISSGSLKTLFVIVLGSQLCSRALYL